MPKPWERYGGQPQGGVYSLPNPRQDRSDANDAQARRDAHIRLLADLQEKGLTLDARGNIVPLPNTGTPGDSSKTGDEYLATLPPDLQREVKMLSDGRMQFPTGAALRNPKMQQLVAAAAQYDPALDAANAATRVATRKNFTSGKARANITSMNTALGHIGSLAEAGEKLDNGNWPLINSGRNAWRNFSGDERVHNFNIERNAVADELTRVFRQAGGNVADIEAWKAEINAAESPEQLRGVTSKAIELLGSRLNSMGDEYNAGMSKSDDPISLLNPHAQDVFNHYGPGGDGNMPTPGINSGGWHGGSGGGAMPGQLTLDDYAEPQTGGPVKAASGSLLGPQFRQEHDVEYQKKAEAMLRGGASYEDMNQFALDSGYGGIDRAEYAAGIKTLNDYPKSHGGRQYQGYIMTAPLKPLKQSMLERVAQGIPGTTTVGLANAASFGAMDAVAPDKMALARAAHPVMEPVGEIAGAIVGTKGLGMAGNAIARPLEGIAPEVMAGIRANSQTAQMGRSIGTDIGYGAGRGAVENPDHPVAGALLGAGSAGAGSLLGNAAGSMLGRSVSGVTSSPMVARLREQGVTPTLGQIMRGRALENGGKSAVAGLEDMLSNTPVAGTFINTARGRALEQANNAAYRIGADGAPINGAGLDALHQLENVRGQAYDNALSGVSIPKDEPGLVSQMNAVDAGRGADEYGRFLDTKLKPAMGRTDAIGGRRLQEALRMLQTNAKGYNKASVTNPAYGDVADALGQTENAFIGATARTHPTAIPKLKQANRINRNLSILDNAAQTASSEGGIFTGPQLGNAIKANNAKFGGKGLTGMARSPLFRLQQDMTAILPNKVPPTGVNVAPAIAGLGLVAGGANEASGFDSNAIRAASALALLTSPYTKMGSAGIAKMLLDRPEALKALGTAMRKKKGLFGTAAVPLMLESQN